MVVHQRRGNSSHNISSDAGGRTRWCGMSAYLVSARAWVAESRTDVESSTILTTCVAVGGRKGDVSGSAQRPAVAHKKREGDAMCMRAEHAWHAQHYNRLCARANVWGCEITPSGWGMAWAMR